MEAHHTGIQKVKGQGHQADWCSHSKCPISSEREGYELQTWYTDGARKPKPASATSAVTFKVKGQGRKVTWCVWQVLANKSRTKRPRKTKIVRKIVHPTSNNEPQTQGQRSKVKVTSATNAETGSESYLPNGKATNFKLGSQTQHEDPHQRQAPWPSRSKVKVARSRDASDRCWPISRERNVLGRPKLVGRLSTPRPVMRPRFKVKGQR